MNRNRCHFGLALAGLAVFGLCSTVRASEKGSDEATFSSVTASGAVGGVSVLSDGMVSRGGGPINDSCSDAPVDTLNIGDTLIYEGDLSGATLTCAALGSEGETWHAFDLTADADVTGSHCGTSPVFGNAFIVIDTDCPCSGAFIFATSFDQTTCDDGNWAVHYDALPAGDYWSPIILDPASGNDGPYVWNISAGESVPPAGCGDPDSGNCCEPNGSPACDDLECCEAICAGDAFCCDTEWDSICADAAVLECAVCGGPGGEGSEGGGDCVDNQLCEDALAIAPGDTLDGNSCEDAGCNDGSASCGASDGADVWYTFTSSCDVAGTVSASTCQADKPYDTVLSVHSDCPGTVGNEIVCNDDDCDLSTFHSTVNWDTTPGTTYLIRVAGFSGGCGDFALTLTEECGCQSDDECDDGAACTDDMCNDGVCSNDEIDCDDGDQCTDNFCVEGECQAEDNGECCEGCGTCDGDVNCDGAVDPLDSGAILARFGLDPCNEENCKYDVNCDGAIDPLDSGYVLARFDTCNEPMACKICSNELFNDNCEDASVDSLSIGETLTYNGTLTGATSTCDALGALGETWHAFDLTEDANVTGSHCGTDPVFGNAFIVVDTDCPCSGAFVFATSFDQITCSDGNWAIHYDGLPVGDYWSPIILDPASGNDGPYTWNISAE